MSLLPHSHPDANFSPGSRRCRRASRWSRTTWTPRRSARTATSAPRRRTWGPAVWPSSSRSTSSLTACWRTGPGRCWTTWTTPPPRRASSCCPTHRRTAVDAFLKAKKLPEKIGNDLVQGMQTGVVGPRRHPGEARRTARRPRRRRRSLHGRADSDPVRGVRPEDHPWQGSRRRSVWSSTVAKRPEGSRDHAPVHTTGLARPGLGWSRLRPPQQERLLHRAAAHPGRSGRRAGGQGGGPAPGRTRRLAAAVLP